MDNKNNININIIKSENNETRMILHTIHDMTIITDSQYEYIKELNKEDLLSIINAYRETMNLTIDFIERFL